MDLNTLNFKFDLLPKWSPKLKLSVPWYVIIIFVLINKKGVILKVELSIRDQLEILSYRGSDKDILDIQKEVKKDWLNYLLEKAS